LVGAVMTCHKPGAVNSSRATARGTGRSFLIRKKKWPVVSVKTRSLPIFLSLIHI